MKNYNNKILALNSLKTRYLTYSKIHKNKLYIIVKHINDKYLLAFIKTWEISVK